MYCPICKFYYDTKALSCPDCETLLIDSKTINNTAAVKPDDSWVVIAGVDDDINRQLAKSSLDSSNIPSVFINSGNKENAKQLGTLINNKMLSTDHDFIIVPFEYKNDALSILKGLFGIELDFDIKENMENNY